MEFEGLTKAIIEAMKRDNPPQAETAAQRRERLMLIADCIQHNPWSKAHRNLTKQCKLANIAPKVAEQLKEIAPDEGKPEYLENARQIFLDHYKANEAEADKPKKGNADES